MKSHILASTVLAAILSSNVFAHSTIDAWASVPRAEEKSPEELGVASEEAKQKLLGLIKEYQACQKAGGDCSQIVNKEGGFNDWKSSNPPAGAALEFHASNWDDVKIELSEKADISQVVASDPEAAKILKRELDAETKLNEAKKLALALGRRLVAGRGITPEEQAVETQLTELRNQLAQAKTEEEKIKIIAAIAELREKAPLAPPTVEAPEAPPQPLRPISTPGPIRRPLLPGQFSRDDLAAQFAKNGQIPDEIWKRLSEKEQLYFTQVLQSGDSGKLHQLLQQQLAKLDDRTFAHMAQNLLGVVPGFLGYVKTPGVQFRDIRSEEKSLENEIAAAKKAGKDTTELEARLKELQAKRSLIKEEGVFEVTFKDPKVEELARSREKEAEFSYRVRDAQLNLNRILKDLSQGTITNPVTGAVDRLTPNDRIRLQAMVASYRQQLKEWLSELEKLSETGAKLAVTFQDEIKKEETRIAQAEATIATDAALVRTVEEVRTVASVEVPTVTLAPAESTTTVPTTEEVTSTTTQEEATTDPDLTADPTQNTAQTATNEATVDQKNTTTTSEQQRQSTLPALSCYQ